MHYTINVKRFANYRQGFSFQLFGQKIFMSPRNKLKYVTVDKKRYKIYYVDNVDTV